MLEKSFTPAQIESSLYDQWERSGLFSCQPTSSKPTYTIMMPPPNVTGSLHLGHALTYTLQDILIRYKRLKGYDVLWQPGTDHAGIATQMVVERNLAAEGLNRRDLGREKFLEKVWAWKEESGGMIVSQQRRLGISPDWSRQRFTMDEGLCQAVRRVFVELYNQGLIYRDKRLVNWDPKFQTAISDIEAIPQEVKGHLWFIHYPLVENPNEFITVATTRPETMLGDSAVAVHPDDERYTHLIGKMVHLPLTDRVIPIVGDTYCDPEKGSGAVKITPAHDFNDFEVGKRHDLPMMNILDSRAHLNEIVPMAYQGLSVSQARQKVLEDLTEKGLLEKTESIVHTVPHGERSGVEIQPWLTDQWYLDAHTLAQPAIKAVEDGKTTFVPEFWSSTYFEWLNNIQPWCISRQLWWGHQIPAWFSPEGDIFVAESAEEAHKQALSKYGHAVELTQDPDVLDTWFSSALWPFSTLNWPDNAAELERYYPTDVLCTGFDIIFFWVARMMMMGLHFMKEVPFKTVYIHALIRDERGAKMSKSKGNVIDPLMLMDKYGSDAVRFTLAQLAVPGRDIKLGESRIEGSRNFMTKIWNAARYLQMNECARSKTFRPENATLTVNRWIISELVQLADRVGTAIEAYRFDEASNDLYRFLWGTFCDFYLEFLKPIFANVEEKTALEESRATAAWVFGEFLRIANPFIPYISEELWKSFGDGELLLGSEWPSYVESPEGLIDSQAQEEMGWLVQLISEIRSRRAEFNVPAGATIPLSFYEVTEEIQGRINRHELLLKKLARLSDVDLHQGHPTHIKGAVQFIVSGTTIVLPLEGTIDLGKEIARLKQDILVHEKEISTLKGRLSNEDFMNKAKPEVIEDCQERLEMNFLALEKSRMALSRLQ